MVEILKKLHGDKGIWSFVALLAIFSFMPVFSASSTIELSKEGTQIGKTINYLAKHFAHVSIGFLIIYFVHKIPYHYFGKFISLVLPVVWFLLALTLYRGTEIQGANASRWLTVPFTSITFQTSALASVTLMIYVARYLSKKRETAIGLGSSLRELWLPVFVTVFLILPANLSTAALLFTMVLMLTFIGKYPLKFIGFVVVIGLSALVFFVVVAKYLPDAFPKKHRVDTWISRVDNFFTDKPNEDDYQIKNAKIAIAQGGIYGLGPGKSVQKNLLPQSTSDFIFAIIIEEWGVLGGLGILLLYLLLLFRFVIAAHKAKNLFGKLLVVGLGFPIIFQALVNMCVAVELLPVTGQTLPLISSGGTSIWMTCLALGIIIGITKKDQEIAQEIADEEKRKQALQRLIDQQIKREEEAEAQLALLEKSGFSIADVANGANFKEEGKG